MTGSKQQGSIYLTALYLVNLPCAFCGLSTAPSGDPLGATAAARQVSATPLPYLSTPRVDPRLGSFTLQDVTCLITKRQNRTIRPIALQNFSTTQTASPGKLLKALSGYRGLYAVLVWI